jgi:hypothetical protein
MAAGDIHQQADVAEVERLERRANRQAAHRRHGVVEHLAPCRVRREHLEHGTAQYFLRRRLPRAQRVQQFGVDAQMVGVGQEIQDVACGPRLRAQHLRGEVGGKRARCLFFEHPEAREGSQHAIERVFVRVRLPRQFRHGLGSGGQPIGQSELEGGVQRARTDITPGDLESELGGGGFGWQGRGGSRHWAAIIL